MGSAASSTPVGCDLDWAECGRDGDGLLGLFREECPSVGSAASSTPVGCGCGRGVEDSSPDRAHPTPPQAAPKSHPNSKANLQGPAGTKVSNDLSSATGGQGGRGGLGLNWDGVSCRSCCSPLYS